jgi:hypothetical protein
VKTAIDAIRVAGMELIRADELRNLANWGPAARREPT